MRKGYSVLRDFSWIENYKLSSATLRGSVITIIIKLYLLLTQFRSVIDSFNFSPLSGMRHSYLRCSTFSSDTVPVYYLLHLFSIAGCSTLNALLRIAGYPTPYSRVSYFECLTPYKCPLLRINIIRCPASYKNPTLVDADRFGVPVSRSLRGTFLLFFPLHFTKTHKFPLI